MSSPKCPHLGWGPSNNVFNCYCVPLSGIKQPEPGEDYPIPYRLKVKHSSSFASAPHTRLYGMVLNQHKNRFTRARRYFLIGNIKDLLWGPPNLTLNRHRLSFSGLKRPELVADHSPLPKFGWGVKNKHNYKIYFSSVTLTSGKRQIHLQEPASPSKVMTNGQTRSTSFKESHIPVPVACPYICTDLAGRVNLC